MPEIIYGIAGPTASGKTALSVSIAKKIKAEIISVDSSLVYKGINIGTAKPSLQDCQEIKHHLIDIINPEETFSVADFIANVNKLKTKIYSQGKQILLVGGTMLYFKSLIEGLSSLPESQPEIRNTLKLEKKIKGLQYLYQQLHRLDHKSAQKINPNDQQRIFRALEVIIISGKKYSDLIQTPKTNNLKEKLKLCAIVPTDRSLLYKYIEQRFKKMLKKGFLHEVEQLRKNSSLTKESAAIKSVGYRQAWAYLDGDISYQDFIEKSIIATRQLAKRQLTWLRNWKNDIKFVTMEDVDKENQILQYFGF